MIIRPATTKDLQACEQLCRVEELQFIGGGYATTDYLSHFLNKKYFLVAEEQNNVIGCAYGEELKANGVILWMVAVEKKQRGKGIGKKLVQAFEKNCEAQGKEWLYLLRLDTEQHERFYASLGFKEGKKLVECLKEPLEK